LPHSKTKSSLQDRALSAYADGVGFSASRRFDVLVKPSMGEVRRYVCPQALGRFHPIVDLITRRAAALLIKMWAWTRTPSSLGSWEGTALRADAVLTGVDISDIKGLGLFF
jgi:hypothetical protein